MAHHRSSRVARALLLLPLATLALACEAPAPPAPAQVPEAPAPTQAPAAPAPTQVPAAPTPAAATMKAVRVHAFGGADALKYEDAPRPQPGPGDVLIRVHAAGVNPVDAAIREGRLQQRLQHKLPVTLGWDVSGVVEEVGQGVARIHKGDAVYAYTDLNRDGAYAEYMVAREQAVAQKPASLDHVKAAAVPVGALTAWQALVDKAGLKAGQTVLIHGAAGGVGTMAVQIAKIRGARVIATASAGNLDYLKSLGADQVIDYKATRFEDKVKGVDVVLDTIGGETQERSWKVLKKGGFLVSLRDPPSEDKAKEHGVRAAHILVQPNADELAEIGKLIDAGRIQVVVSEVLPLRDVQRAHAQIETKHTRGKLVLRVAE